MKKCEARTENALWAVYITRRSVGSKAMVLLLFIHCLSLLTLCGGSYLVLGLNVILNHNVLSNFAMILLRKRKLVALL